MSMFYVFQGETYEEERSGEYVWSPQLTKNGRKNAGYSKMKEICKGDYILHNSNGKIVAISVAKSDCYEAQQPWELSEADTSVIWDDDGYRVDTDYFDFDVPLLTSNYVAWMREHYIKGSAFTTAGRGKQQYMCSLADEHAAFLLKEAIRLQNSPEVLSKLNNALYDIGGDR